MMAPEALGSAFNANDMQMDMLYGTAIGENLRAVMVDDNGKRYMISGKEIDDWDRVTYEDIPVRQKPLVSPFRQRNPTFCIMLTEIKSNV